MLFFGWFFIQLNRVNVILHDSARDLFLNNTNGSLSYFLCSKLLVVLAFLDT